MRCKSVILLQMAILLLGGCVASYSEIERLDQDIQGVVLDVAAIRGDVSLIRGDVGGGGDSITAWLYAMIAGASLLYPAVIRPIRKRVFPDKSVQKTT